MVDRFQIFLLCQHLQPRLSSVFFTATSESRRLSRFLVRRRPPSFLTATSGTTARRRVGWVRLLVMFSHFLFCFFFLLTSSFAAQSLHSTLLADGHGRPFPRGPTRPHYRPRRRMTTLTCPLVTACAMSPCLSRLHLPRRCARVTMLLAPAYPLPVCFLFSFSANFLFCSPVTAHEPKKSCQASHRFTWDQVVRTHFKHPRTSETDLLAFDEIHSDNLVVGKGRQDWEGKTKDGK